jgi:hypothetical protein
MNSPTPSRIQIRRPGTPPVQDRRRLALLAGAWLLTRAMTRNAYTRNDAPLSVRRAYTADEVVDLARQAGLRPVARYWARPGYRYALVFVRDRA